MAIDIKPQWAKFIPHLEIYVNVPLIRVGMVVLMKDYEWLRFQYLGLQWEIWKWRGHIRLFQTHKTLNIDAIPQDDIEILKCRCFISKKYKFKKFCDKHYEVV